MCSTCRSRGAVRACEVVIFTDRTIERRGRHRLLLRNAFLSEALPRGCTPTCFFPFRQIGNITNSTASALHRHQPDHSVCQCRQCCGDGLPSTIKLDLRRSPSEYMQSHSPANKDGRILSGAVVPDLTMQNLASSLNPN